MQISRRFLSRRKLEAYRRRVNERLDEMGEYFKCVCSPYYGSIQLYRIDDPDEDGMAYVCGVVCQDRELKVAFPFRPCDKVFSGVRDALGFRARTRATESQLSAYMNDLQRREVACSEDSPPLFRLPHLPV